jgi:hypothetical protein
VQVLDLELRRIEERGKGKKMVIDAKPDIFWPHMPFKN